MDGKTARPSTLIRGAEEIAFEPGHAPPLRAEPENLPLTVLYEDADVIVVDKAAGMVVHAGAGHKTGTLVNALLHRYGSLSNGSNAMRPGLVHRLDRDTSGVIVIARHDAAHQHLANQFQERTVAKVYWALVHGVPAASEGRVATPIMRDPLHRTRMTTKLKQGRSAVTTYRVMEASDRFSFLEVKIGTGRTHQIRVHLASIGYPVVGDKLYGAPKLPSDLPGLDRFFLHAHRLTFESPSSGKAISIESSLPAELDEYLTAIRQRSATAKIKSTR